ncbi:MAG: Gfo/Idh/MocA family oxidoreductase [Draconibacterium sp.]|nr:Gfo/Idh/MocA family oxidoreductase [Draconibacterium sp.]
MNRDRRDFLKIAGLAGLSIPAVNALFAQNQEDERNFKNLPKKIEEYQKNHTQVFNMSGYAAPKISTVRIGIIGTGNRGSHHAETISRISDVEIRAAADVLPERFERIKKNLKSTDHNPEYYAGSHEEWKKLCERNDLDLVLITTPTYLHAEMAVYAMEQGKHVITEVPAAMTIRECWDIVKISEKTRKHCMMMENYSYMPFHITTLNMAKQGFFGDIVHGDGAYNTSKMRNNFSKTMYWNMWWLRLYGSRKGNIYPTHGMGAIAQMMNINRGDQLDFVVSVESKDFMMAKKAKELAEDDPFFEEFAKMDYRGNMNSMLIKTKQGRTINIQHDATSPSPHNQIHGVYGTEGAVLYDPAPPRISIGEHKWVDKKSYDKLIEKYKPGLLHRFEDFRKGLGADIKSGHGGSDLINVWHIIDCLRTGLPLDQDVYDAAALSSVVELSEWSVLNNSNSIKIPDFTAGAWKVNKPNMDINLENGFGDTKVLR